MTNLYPEAASEGGKGGGQRKGDRKRKESGGDGDGAKAEEEIKFTKGCILVIKELAEGQVS